MKGKILIVWNIVLTFLMVFILVGGCTVPNSDLENEVERHREAIIALEEAINENRTVINENRELIKQQEGILDELNQIFNLLKPFLG